MASRGRFPVGRWRWTAWGQVGPTRGDKRLHEVGGGQAAAWIKPKVNPLRLFDLAEAYARPVRYLMGEPKRNGGDREDGLGGDVS